MNIFSKIRNAQTNTLLFSDKETNFTQIAAFQPTVYPNLQ